MGFEHSPVLSARLITCGEIRGAKVASFSPMLLPVAGGSGTVVSLGELMMILELHRQGLTVSAIARQLGLDRKTVAKYIACGMERRQDLGCAAPDVFVRLEGGLAARLPGCAGMRHGLKGAGLVLTPDREPKLRPPRVGLPGQLFF